MHEWMLQAGLSSPATFADSAASAGHQWTWRSPHGSCHRLDYVLIEESMMQQVVRCGRTDHVAAVVEAALGSRVRAEKQAPWYSRALLQLPSYQERVRELWATVPAPPAGWAADVLAALHAKCCRLILAEACPPGIAAPLKPWIQEDTWGQIRHNAKVKRQLAWITRRIGDDKLRLVFSLWTAVIRPKAATGRLRCACRIASQLAALEFQ